MIRVKTYETYTWKGTDYLLVIMTNEKMYRFNKPAGDAVPYTFEKRYLANGFDARHQRAPLPDALVNWLEDSHRFDVSDLHGRPSSERKS